MFEWGDLGTVGVLVVLEGLLSADNAMVMAVMVLGLPAREPAIVDGAFIIIAWVGSKLLTEYLHAGFIPLEIPQWFSLTVIVGIFVASLFYARQEAARHRVRHLEGLTAEDAANVFVDTDG